MRHCYILVVILLAVGAFAAQLAVPQAPVAQVVGKTGGRTVCYWLFAESAEKAPDAGAWYLKGIPGKVTALSRPCVVTNAPDALDADNTVVLTWKPVDGAVRYHILKTEYIPSPTLEVKAKAAGNDTLYYWAQAHNGWRHSPLSGPFPVQCDLNSFVNTITVVKNSPLQTDHSIWVTQTPEPPLGRKPQVIGMRRSYSPVTHSAEWVKKNRLFAAWGPGPEPATVPQEIPYGTTNCWLGSTNELIFTDSGQPLKPQEPPAVDETAPGAFEDPYRMQSNRVVHNNFYKRVDFNGHTSMGPNFYGGFFPMELELFANRGGVNYYQNQPGAYPGYKSTFGLANLTLTSYTESQFCGQNTMVRNYGTGDTIAMGANLELYGGNRDSGDEGAEIMRASVDRQAAESKGTLAADAAKGAVYLRITSGMQGATGRTVINLTQAQNAGRIDRVDNCDIYGEGTKWTPAMTGWFISFDVDNAGGVRYWHQVVEVVSPTHLKVRMWTNWRYDCNLGYSRFIFNPAKGQTVPRCADKGLTVGAIEKNPYQLDPLYTNRLAIGVLPKEREKAAGEGKYQIAPGTTLADGWNEGGLHVEPITEPWMKGDNVLVAAGHSQPITYWWGVLFGTLAPQDRVEGIAMANFTNRTANGNAFSSVGFQMGLHVDLPKNREGNGVIVSGEPVDAAYLAAADVPLLRCYNSLIPYLQGSEKQTALEIVAPTGERPLSVSKDTVTLNAALHGNGQTRGKAEYLGDGKTTRYLIRFPREYTFEPVVTISANQFARCRLVGVNSRGFTVEFENAPKAGDKVAIWWMAQE
jgi:hypothetical protein